MKKIIRVSKLMLPMAILSIVLILVGVAGYFVRGGFNLGIDYTAGMTQHIRILPGADAPIDAVRSALEGIGTFELQAVGPVTEQEFMIKVRAPQDDKAFQERMEAQIYDLLSEEFGTENVDFRQSDFVGPRYSRNLVGQTISITLVALILILIYLAFRFRFVFAVSAVLCLIHDVLFMAGVVAIFQLEFTTTTIAAILTIIGYSLNDTIVIFDRVRENRALMRDSDLETIINTSITQSLSRTLLTSITTLIAVVAIYVFGTEVIRNFALNLMIGVVVGTYSTLFIASTIALSWNRALDRRRKSKDLQKYGRPAATGPAPKEAAPAVVGEQPKPVDERGQIQVTRVQPSKKKKKKKKKR